MLDGKLIWITGASSGIGEALALALARKGARLALTARRADRLEQLRDRCPAPDQVTLVPGDLLDEASWSELPRRVEELAGPVDVLVNNAGLSQRADALDTRIEDVRRIMGLNFFAPVALTNAVLPGMIERRSGQIVVISSVAGYVGTPKRSTYSASKHAVRGYFDSLRAELAETGVSVTIVCPGYVRTEITEHAVGDGGKVHGRTDESIAKGITAEACAARIVDAMERRRSELYVGGKEVAAIYLKRLLPGLIERIVPTQVPS